MSRRMNVYYGAILGALGGLIGWATLGSLSQLEQAHALIRALLEGAIVGAFIGALVGSVEGALNGNVRELSTGLFRSLALSAVGGALGLAVGEVALQVIGGGVVARSIGWLSFGAAVGAAQGVVRGSIPRGVYGAIGGLVGGLTGGLLLEFLALQGLELQSVTRAIGLLLLGTLIGALIALVSEAFVHARVRVMNGRREGREYALDKADTTMGAGDSCDIYLPGDPSVRSLHAHFRSASDSVEVTPAGDAPVLVNGHAIRGPAPLKNGDQLQIGSTRLRLLVARTKA